MAGMDREQDRAALVARYPLPADLTAALDRAGIDPSLPLSRTLLARAFNTSENTITKWVVRGMPVETEGANGVAYEFDLAHCYAWRQAQADRDASRRRAQDQLAAQASMVFRNLDDDVAEAEGAMTAADVRAWAEAEYHRNRAAEQRGALVRADRMREVLEDLLVAVRNAMTTLPDFAERELGLDNAAVAKLQARCDETLVEMRRGIEEARLADRAQVSGMGRRVEIEDAGGW